MESLKKFGLVAGIGLAGLLALALLGFGVFYAGWVDFIDNYEIGYKYDVRDGKITVLEKRGWIITPPVLVSVHTVDLRPMQVCINANSRVLNCKLVQFDPKGLELFLSWHGRKDYNSSNSGSSYNGSAGDFNDILKSYAYDGSGKTYPFLTVLRELKPEEVQ